MSAGLLTTATQRNQQRERLFRRAARHSFVVRLLRLAIPVGSLALVVLLVGAYVMARNTAGDMVAGQSPDGLENGRLVMQQPRLTGFQPDSRSYEVTAASATQDAKSQIEVALARPEAVIEMTADRFARIVANAGVFDTRKESLSLSEKIKIVTDSGYTLLMNSADVDLGEGNIDSKDKVTVEMTTGRIEAKGMTARNSGESIIFSGGVRSTFDSLFGPPGLTNAPDAATSQPTPPGQSP